jgi:hypothetical protein
MLQLIETTCPSAPQPTPAQPSAYRRRLPLALAIAAVLSFGVTSAAVAQDSSSAPATTKSGKPVVAAPGTVAVSAATAAALQPYTGPKYDNRWEVYGGLMFMNGQAGQNLPKRFNMGGAEVMGTYWLGDGKHGVLSKLGIAADGRFGAGTTPVLSPFYNRVVVMEGTFMGGLQYRGPKNRYAAVDLHVLGGGAYGIFDYAVNHYPVTPTSPYGSPVTACAATTPPPPYSQGTLGLYCNHAAPYGAVGGSIDFNESGKLAIRLQPDLTFEHFGTETREFFSISMGALYRFGGEKTKKQ